MKPLIHPNAKCWIVWPLLLVLLAATARAEDMRQAPTEARQARQTLIEKAAAERRAAEQAAAESRQRLAQDRAALEKELRTLETRHAELAHQAEQLTEQMTQLGRQEEALSQRLGQSDAMVRELVGVIRVGAKDLSALIAQNLPTGEAGADSQWLESIANQSRFPGMADVRRMTVRLIQAIGSGGEVSLRRGTIIDRAGNPAEADILALGNFTAAYRLGKEVGFLIQAPAGRDLYALSRLPDRGLRRRIARYMDGEGEAVPLDLSRGGALRQLTHQLSLWGQIPKGGPIVWPILAILAVALALIAERVLFLWRRRGDGDDLIRRIATWAAERKWEACQQACERLPDKPVARVVAAGLGCRRMQREEMEAAMQEAILREIPALERFLSTLGMLAAIAPLLGLLGTVTGMIDTFHVITQHGTGDPRLMSGGISEALVTTMLGLTVAIPIMLAHTLLNRAVDNQIGGMEEKAVALVNIVQKSMVN